MTIYDIKQLTQETNPYFFNTKTLKFFGQTLKSFKVGKCEDGRYFISAPIRDSRGKVVSKTEKFFNPVNNELESV